MLYDWRRMNKKRLKKSRRNKEKIRKRRLRKNSVYDHHLLEFMEVTVFHSRLKSIILLLNVVIVVIGMCIFSFGLFVLCSNQGGLNPSLFNFVGSITALYGFTITELSHMNHRAQFIYGKLHGEMHFHTVSLSIFRYHQRYFEQDQG
jgi:hypothetical protein